MTKAKPTAKAPAVVDKSRIIAMGRLKGETDDQAVARMLARGTVVNASIAIEYSRQQHAGLSLTDLARALREQGDAVNRGDLSDAERMLSAQAVALNAIFAELARRAAQNMGEYLDATDRYMRLALKAQGQCRATIETLAAMKNPPVVFARQANIAHGPQQVNNSAESGLRAGARAPENSAHSGAHAANQSIERIELLEASDAERVDFGAQGAAGGANPNLAPMGAINRADDRGR